MRCRESTEVAKRKDGGWANFVGHLKINRFFVKELRPVDLFWDSVKKYGSRQLSADSDKEMDALNAFSSVIQKMGAPHPSSGMESIPYVMGMPVIGQCFSWLIENFKDFEGYDFHMRESLGWLIKPGAKKSHLVRRQRFPSWSWLGWKVAEGACTLDGPLSGRYGPLGPHGWSWLQLLDGTEMTFQQYLQMAHDLRSIVQVQHLVLETYIWDSLRDKPYFDGPNFTGRNLDLLVDTNTLKYALLYVTGEKPSAEIIVMLHFTWKDEGRRTAERICCSGLLLGISQFGAGGTLVGSGAKSLEFFKAYFQKKERSIVYSQ